jgi:hypothetical protein
MRPNAKIVMLVGLLGLSSLACEIFSVTIGNRDSIRGSGPVVQETRPVSGINAVEVGNQGNLFIEIGDSESLVIEAEENLIGYLTSDVQNGTLVLKTQPGVNIQNREPINYYLTVIALSGLATYSSGDIEAPAIEADRFRIDVSSSGDVSLDALFADQLKVDISSSGSVRISGGEVVSQEIDISSSGSYEAEDIDSQQAVVRISSSGNADIQVQDTLVANLSSSGNVNYVGDPHVTARESSSGRVIQR